MRVFNRCFVLLELSVQLLSVVSYTVVLKQVKPTLPSLKIYRYELRHPKIFPESNVQYIHHRPFLGQRIYPVAVKPGRDGNALKARVPGKKEKGKYYKAISTTEKPVSKSPRLLGLSQHLAPPLSNQIEEYSEAKEEEEAREVENDIRPLLASPHAGKSFSSFAQKKGKIYNSPGEWATPAPQVDSENSTNAEFTPSQLYLQIRHKNTVIHVPQSEALKDAETLEELINAPRLKELSRTTHVQETYSEEGYEDAGYDHAGHIRQAQHGEVYDAKDEGKFRIKEAPIILDYDSDLEESQKLPLKSANEKENDSTGPGLSNNKLEPRITRSRSEMSKTTAEFSKAPRSYKGEHKYSSRVRNPPKITDATESKLNTTETKDFSSFPATFPSYFGDMLITTENALASDPATSYKFPGKKSSKYRKSDLNSTKIFPVSELTSLSPPAQVDEYTNFKPYISLIDSQASPSAKSLKYSRIYSKKTKHLRLEPYQNGNIYPRPPPLFVSSESPPHSELKPPSTEDNTEEAEEELINQRIVLPTIGYINSLTTAHFGKENSKPLQDESKPLLSKPLNLTQALNYLRNNKNQQNLETTKSPAEIDVRTFEPMRLKKFRPNSHNFANKAKRDVYLMGTRERMPEERAEEDEGNDESDLPHDEKNEEIAEDERKRIEEEKREKEKFEAELRDEILNKEKEIIKATLENFGVEKDVSEVFPEFPSESKTDFPPPSDETTPAPVDLKKYPFYTSKRLPENSALRYATDPKEFPKKSGYKMEFYESRERLFYCPDFHPELGDLPNSNSTEFSDEQAGETQRLTSVGTKIACLRMKYFDPEPFDNPIFKEREIDYVGKPSKNHKKVRAKLASKPLRLDGKDQQLRSMTHQKSYHAEDRNASRKNTSSVNVSQAFKPNQVLVGTASQKIRNQPSDILNPLLFPQASSDKTEKGQIKPVLYTPIPSDTSTTTPVSGWKTVYYSKYESGPKASKTKSRSLKSHNCLTAAILGGNKNLAVDCNGGVTRAEGVIPKTSPREGSEMKEWDDINFSQQSDWVPIVGYTIVRPFDRSAKPLARRTDEVTKLKNETNQNANSAHYVIDELKEDDNVRKGEVVEDMDHYLDLMKSLENKMTDNHEVTTLKPESTTHNSTREKREAQSNPAKPKKQNNFSRILEFSLDKTNQNQSLTKSETDKPPEGTIPDISKTFELKRPLTRLSGIDFLVRYHKTKNKPAGQRVQDFWRITTAVPVEEKSMKKTPKIGTQVETHHTNSQIKEEKSDKVTTSSATVETTVKKYRTKESSEFRKHQTDPSDEKSAKPKSKQTNESQKFPSPNLIPEKLTKKPECKSSESLKTSCPNPVTEKSLTKPFNYTKIVTKISKVTSKTSESRSPSGNKQTSSHSERKPSTKSPEVKNSSEKPEMPQYKTINRSPSSANEDSDLSRSTESPEGPVLYYVVNLKTGRGKWITNHREQRRGSLDKHRKIQKFKENSGTKKTKGKRKKSKY